jgi:hypothetical protein
VLLSQPATAGDVPQLANALSGQRFCAACCVTEPNSVMQAWMYCEPACDHGAENYEQHRGTRALIACVTQGGRRYLHVAIVEDLMLQLQDDLSAHAASRLPQTAGDTMDHNCGNSAPSVHR